MNQTIHLLMIEDSGDDAELILREVRKGGLEVVATRIETADELTAALQQGGWDLILSDYSLPGFSGLIALEILTAAGLDLPFIIVSGAIGEETAVQLMRAGAKDYVRKEKLARLVPVLRRELNDAASRKECILAEQALTQSRKEEEATRNKIEHIIKSIPDGLLVCDEENRVVLMNEVAESLLNVSAAAAMTQPISLVVPDNALRKQLLDCRASTSVEPLKSYLHLLRPGSAFARTIQARTSQMKEQGGKISGTVTILSDVTRERELDRLKSEFISTAAHELNTPLATIIGYLELLLKSAAAEDFNPEQQREFLQEIYGKSLFLAAIVDELLDLSRMESGQGLRLHKEGCSLRAVIEKAVKQIKMQAPQHRFEIALPAGLPEELLLDCHKISEVMENLLSNAVKYSPQGGRISVSGALHPGYFEGIVADEGIGLDPAETSKVFEKFYRVDASNTAVRGLGLGLSIVRQIVEAHGGTIRLESQLGKGTRAIFTLPLVPMP
uniref:histidine kinase n=2 Tax=environmental samples TaxID=48479 RepID=A0A1C9U4T6_9BACT|nr:histidine kinase [uncultured bacterium pAY4-1]AOR51208.1 histidine kinase [uncultured bacterium pAY4-2]